MSSEENAPPESTAGCFEKLFGSVFDGGDSSVFSLQLIARADDLIFKLKRTYIRANIHAYIIKRTSTNRYTLAYCVSAVSSTTRIDDSNESMKI